MTAFGGGSKPNGRPRGLVRLALVAWARQWAASGRDGGLSLSELAAQVPGMHAGSAVDRRMLGNTLKAMVRAGELVCCGFAPLAGRNGLLRQHLRRSMRPLFRRLHCWWRCSVPGGGML